MLFGKFNTVWFLLKMYVSLCYICCGLILDEHEKKNLRESAVSFSIISFVKCVVVFLCNKL